VPPSSDDELVPELYQLVGAALRDVAQARFMSDVFSRQISFVYEGDGVLRRFPVPRVDIEEAEITLHFAINQVAIDPDRRSSRNAAIGAWFDKYSVRIVRAAMWEVREAIRSGLGAVNNDPSAAAILADLEKGLLSDENRELVTGRLLQKFNESADAIIDDDKNLKSLVLEFMNNDKAVQMLWSELQILQRRFPVDSWSYLREKIEAKTNEQIEDLAEAIGKLRTRYPDYKLSVDPNAQSLAASGAPISSIKIKSTVRNYKWSKVEVDETDMRNIRTLNPE
jgi:hypothetical protein